MENRNEYHDMIITKMKIIVTLILLTATLLMSTVSSTEASGKSGYRIYDTSSGLPVSLKELGKSIGDYDVMAFGEYHDNPVLHRLEEELLIEVYAQHPNLAVALEMFERDAQQTLNAYLAGRLDEAAFLEQSRPWKNYGSDYRPLVEFAKEKGLRVLAANIPRSMAAYYARQGTLDGIDGAMRHYLPAAHRAPDGEYRQRFFAQMQAISEKHTVMAMTEKQMEAFYRAQCLKDDTMAESIVEHHRRYPERKVIHYQGDFHSHYRLGVTEKLQALEPELKVLVITPVYVEQFKNLSTKAKNLQADGDIVIFLQQPAGTS